MSVFLKILKYTGITLLVIICTVIFVMAVPLVTGAVFPGKKPDAEKITNPYIVSDKALVSAHRSGGEIAPENTMMAFRNCIEAENFDVDIFEFDLHITKDGRLILLHDGTLDRTTDAPEFFGEEEVMPSEKTYEELRQLNFGENFTDKDGNTPYKGLRGDDIPEDLRAVLLEDVLDYLTANGDFRYIIEIKDGGTNGERAADGLYSILKEKNLLDKVIFGTFKNNVTKYVDENYPDMLRSASIPEVLKFYFACGFGINLKAENLEYEALQIPANQFVAVRLGNERTVNYAHSRNIAVQYWTINDPEDVEMLNSLGADCIMSDDPDMAYDIINSGN